MQEHSFDALYEDGLDTYRDSLATVDEKGKRIWIFPKKPNGDYYHYRKLVSYVLLLILFGLPWIKYRGEPLFLFNILKRKFILFGVHFGPQDFHIMVIGMLVFIIFIALFTVVFGRLFCGWVCPQTIFMEMVYRRIEYWIEGDYKAQARLNKAPWDFEKVTKKLLKQIIFFSIAVLIANTFLAYIIGMDNVLKIISEPISDNIKGFTAMIIFSAVFYGVFASLREQVCTTICPYGRLQGVLLDKNSQAVYYDFKRGEPRGKIRKNQTNQSETGDCIDCNLCVKVCPTGIDIRDGIQLECVNCTACIDACDEVMEKVNRPKGLIRIDSYTGITEGKKSLLNARSIAYSILLLVLVGVELALLFGRSSVEVLILRTPGTLFYEREEGVISNLYNYQLINKVKDEVDIKFSLINIEGEIDFIGNPPTTKAHENTEGAIFINIPKSILEQRSTKLLIQVYANDEPIQKIKTRFLGPEKQ